MPKPFPVDPQVLAAYAGRYQYSDFIVTICVEGARIFLQAAGDREFELIAISESQFYLREFNARSLFTGDDRR